MGIGVKNRIGQFTYADGAIGEKSFRGRNFIVVIAGARIAGIVGPEDNGIVILDEDHGTVVLDNHVKETSGYFGPSRRQIAEFKRIMAMDWAEFSEFVRTHPRYRGSVPDIHDPEPMVMRPQPDRVIFPHSQKEDPDVFPLVTRREIIDFLANHTLHEVGRGRGEAIAWDVKVRNFDASGHHQDFENDPAFDERWDEFVENNPNLFWEAAHDGLSMFLEGDFAPFPDTAPGDFEFATAGRSGGWLVLTGAKGFDVLTWDHQTDYQNWLKGLSDDDVVRLYKLVATVDRITANPEAEMAYQFAAIRSGLEQVWAADAALQA
jgi:hypothetical protein